MNMNNPHELTSLSEIVRYLTDIIGGRGKKPDEELAARIVGLETNSRIDEWSKEEPELGEILSSSWDLEWSNGDPEVLEAMWRKLEERVVKLRQKYLNEGDDT
jgi:hypothetical protein